MVELFNSVHLEEYFQYIIFFLILWAFIQCARGVVYDNKIVSVNQIMGMILAVVVILMMGMRPITSVYGDTVNYASGFNYYASHKSYVHLELEKEWLFENTMRMFAKYSDIHSFFTVCATVYVGALWLAMRRIFKEYNFLPLLIIMCMFTFWHYGVNGVRNGMGASLFILAMTCTESIPTMLLISFIGAGIHNSVYLMLIAAAIAWVRNDSRFFIGVWIASIAISLVFGSQIQASLSGFASVMDETNKLSRYLSYSHQEMVSEGVIMSTSFRWDFVAYSAMGVALGAYFIIRRKFEDEYYQWIFNTYLICNSFWILIIRAPFSNRFAQISWFILPLVLIYPFMRERFWVNHERVLAVSIMIFYAYNFIYNVVPILLK